MTTAEIAAILRTINSVWRPVLDEYQQREWVDFLMDYDVEPAKRAVSALRGSSEWRPSMSAFRESYLRELDTSPAAPADRPLLGAGDEATYRNGRRQTNAEKNQDLYGSSVDDWVYCWQCDLAITLAELDTDATYRQGYGFRHHRCPPHGSRPSIPNAERRTRAEHWQRTGISV